MTRRSELIRLLTSYVPRNEQEGRYRTQMLDLAAAAHDPFSRHDYAPGHFTASAFVAHPEGKRVLLVRHRKLALWVQPGGHIDPGDLTPIAAAAREVFEEAGIREMHPVSDDLMHIDIHPIPAHGDQPDHTHYDLRFGFVAGDAALDHSEEVLGALWVTPSALVATGAQPELVEPISRVLPVA
jgi:8-oxo-dGTP pyrophosphatase MutT (NUDIX family)